MNAYINCKYPYSMTPNRSKDIPRNRSISVMWKDKNLRKIFLDIIGNTQFRLCKYLKNEFIDIIDKLVRNNNSDEQIYDEMYNWVHCIITERNRNLMLYNNIDDRSENRASKIKELILQHINSNIKDISELNILDVGCAEGSITVMIGEYLHLNREHVHGCDIIENKGDYADKFTFKHLNEQDNCILPYNNESFDVVLALMSLHHIKNMPNVLKEIRRILKPNGLLIIREHNCVSGKLSVVLDIIHGFYSMVWANPREMSDFSKYYAKYTSADYLTKVIVNTGFKELYNNRFNDYPRFYKGKIINPLNYYYAVYLKNPQNENIHKLLK